jgi:hypothetical protein
MKMFQKNRSIVEVEHPCITKYLKQVKGKQKAAAKEKLYVQEQPNIS